MLNFAQAVTLHTVKGVGTYQFSGADLIDLRWGRELREVSTCDVDISTADGWLSDVVPWLHWVSVWDMSTRGLLWTGPIQKISTTTRQIRISARDAAVFMARTRTPLTKAWEKVDLSVPAAAMWAAMIENHGLGIRPIVRPDPLGGQFDWETSTDAAMMDQAVAQLVQLGLRWSVIAGTPLLGPAPRKALATLGENDFLGDLELIRDGATSYNDILLRGPDTLSTARLDMYGLNLQTIVTVDDMFGVTNADAATKEYARYSSSIRDAIGVGVELNPDAPVSFDQLIPSARFIIAAYGRRMEMELQSIQVSMSAQAEAPACTVAMESVLDLPENLPELAWTANKTSTAVRHR